MFFFHLVTNLGQAKFPAHQFRFAAKQMRAILNLCIAALGPILFSGNWKVDVAVASGFMMQ